MRVFQCANVQVELENLLYVCPQMIFIRYIYISKKTTPPQKTYVPYDIFAAQPKNGPQEIL